MAESWLLSPLAQALALRSWGPQADLLRQELPLPARQGPSLQVSQARSLRVGQPLAPRVEPARLLQVGQERSLQVQPVQRLALRPSIAVQLDFRQVLADLLPASRHPVRPGHSGIAPAAA